MRPAAHIEAMNQRWLATLREHGYDINAIADPDKRRQVVNALRVQGIELLRGDSGTYRVPGADRNPRD
jgi:hypothetical protein